MSNYWTKRFEIEEARRVNGAIKYISQIDKQYDKSLAEIDKKINYWYGKIAKNNEISMSEARKLLTKNELQEFKWTVEEYIAKGIENNISGAWLKQLNNASAKVHISKLEALKVQIQNDIENMYQGLDVGMDKYLKRIYSDTYYRTAFDIGQGLGSINTSFSKLDKNKLNQVIYKPWAKDGVDFSSRIWKDKADLVNTLHTGITQHIIRGGNIEDVIADLTKFVRDKIKNKKAVAARLVRTETAAYASKAQREAYNELEVDKYEIVATLDTHTSEICQDFDGKVFDMKDYEVGVTAPPFHCNCRTVTVPWFPPDIDKGERAARNKDGELIYVPQDMKYPEWYDRYIKNNPNSETISLQIEDKTLKNNEIGDVRVKELNNDNIPIKEKKIISYEEVIEKAKIIANEVNFSNIADIKEKVYNYTDYIIKREKLNGLPKVVSSEEFKKLSKGKVKLYRGIADMENIKAIDMVKDFKYGELFTGKGIYGNGTYATPIKELAKLYETKDGKTSGRMIEMILSDDAKTITFIDLYNQLEESGILQKVSMKSKLENYEEVIGDLGNFGMLKGYDVIMLNGSFGHEHYVILDRAKLIVKE